LCARRTLLGNKIAQSVSVPLLVNLVRHARYTARGVYFRSRPI
jgi:hypothetical protein